jgi:hypothetical protein
MRSKKGARSGSLKLIFECFKLKQLEQNNCIGTKLNAHIKPTENGIPWVFLLKKIDNRAVKLNLLVPFLLLSHLSSALMVLTESMTKLLKRKKEEVTFERKIV